MNSDHSINVVGFLQVFSLDVVAGALAMGMFAVRWCRVSLPGTWWIVLALAVWVIYTSDHLIDGLKKGKLAVNQRHRIHFLLRNPLLVINAFSATVALWLSLFYLDKKVITGGFILGSVVAAYLVAVVLIHRKENYFFKEFFIAAIYVSGIWLAPLIHSGSIEVVPTFLILLFFVLLTVAEGLITAVYEFSADKADHQPSFVTRYGVLISVKLVRVLLSGVAFFSLVMIFTGRTKRTVWGFAITLVMSLVLMAVLHFKNYFGGKGRYRIAGELTFWIPGIIFFLVP